MIAGTMPVPEAASTDDATRVVTADLATQVVRPSANSYTPPPSGIPSPKSEPASVSLAAPPPLAATPVSVAPAAAQQPKRSNTAAYLGVAAVAALIDPWAPVLYWLLPAALAQPLLRLYLNGEHGGVAQAGDSFATARTTLTHPAILDTWLTSMAPEDLEAVRRMLK